jgi:glyoxylase-like metal-dependent hydrolase (beta-lactamase superfamily II)
MQEIGPGIYYKTGYSGVTIGALILGGGTLLVDAPLRVEDSRSWQAILKNHGGISNWILVNLDPHPDRTIGSRLLDCPVIAHEHSAQDFRNRPPIYKSQNIEIGAEWEICPDLISSRWVSPDITFTERIVFHWSGSEIFAEYHPGPALGASWVVFPEKKVAFVGDAVVLDQPPFLGDADIPTWVETLELLLSSQYRSYALISGRGGLVSVDNIRTQRSLLKKINKKLGTLWNDRAPVSELFKMIPGIMAEYNMPRQRAGLYEQRLRYGLERYYTRYTEPVEKIILVEEDKDQIL